MIIPTIFGVMMLGRSFDMNIVQSRATLIFDENDLKDKTEIIKRPFTSARYRITEASLDSNDFLKIDGGLAIKASKGEISLSGFGGYYAETINRENTMEILFTVQVETETHTFPSYVKMRTDWQNKSPDEIGTHYIRSITYGGQLIIWYRAKATSFENKQDIKAALSANLAFGGNININGSGNFEKLANEIRKKSDIVINGKATTSDGKLFILQSLQDAFDLVEKFPSMVGDKGPALRLEIIPLSTLTPKQKLYKPNPVLEALLNEATNKYDDLKVADKDFKAWQDGGHIWNHDQKKLINKYNREMSKALSAFNKAISNLNVEGGTEQFDEALKAYGLNEKNIPNRFTRGLQELRHIVEKTTINWYPYTKGVTHYVHWGSLNCTLPSPDPLYIGLAGTGPTGFGSGASMECLPLYNPGLEKKDMPQDAILSYVNGMRFELPDQTTGPVLCAFCELTNATSVYMVPGAEECPGETKLEYSGYLMTSKDSGTTSTYMCLDMEPQTDIPDQVIEEDQLAATVNSVWMEYSDGYETMNKYLGCVVCSR